MSQIDLNFTGVKTPTFEPVPEGTYKLKLEGCKVQDGKTNPNDKGANCTYSIVEQEDGGTDFVGKKIFNYQTLIGENNDPGYVKLWLEALTGGDIDGQFTFDVDQLLGLEVVAGIGVKPDYRDDTKEVNYIKYFNKA